MERMNKSYGGAEIKKICESLYLFFYPVGSLSFFADKQTPRYIYNFVKSF